jgi:hypothetical protein
VLGLSRVGCATMATHTLSVRLKVSTSPPRDILPGESFSMDPEE